MAVRRPEGEVQAVGRVIPFGFEDEMGVVAVVGGLNVSLDGRLWTQRDGMFRPTNFKRAEVDLHFRVTRSQDEHMPQRLDYLLLGTRMVQTSDLSGQPTVGYEVFDMQREKVQKVTE